jgi:hypothetical protein
MDNSFDDEEGHEKVLFGVKRESIKELTELNG